LHVSLLFILARLSQLHHAIQKVIPYQSMLLPECKCNNYKDYRTVSETLQCTICRLLHLLDNLFFSPVLHCTPHDLPHVIVRFIIHDFQPKNFLKMRCKEPRQHCQSLLNREFEYSPYVSPEFRVCILQ